MNQYCLVCGETRCARVDAECETPCVSRRTEYKGLAEQAAYAQYREGAMARAMYGSAQEWMHVGGDTTPIEAQRYDFVAQPINPYDVGVIISAEEWLSAGRPSSVGDDLCRQMSVAELSRKAVSAIRECQDSSAGRRRGCGSVDEPDGPPVVLPPKPALFREFEAQKHDFIGALYRPYVSPV